MNVREFRSLMGEALRKEGLEELRLFPKGPKVWVLPGDSSDDIIRFFWPHAYRRPWGFSYSGAIGIEIPKLREWLRSHKAGNEGLFQSCFVNYMIANEDILGDFCVTHSDPVPDDLWAGLLRDRLDKVPTKLSNLVATYRRNREELGWLAHPEWRHPWDFLLKWCANPDPALDVPRMLPEGRIG